MENDTGPQYQILVVDGYSSDKTMEKLKLSLKVRTS